VTDREEARTAFANLLMERINQDRYPSSTHMDILENVIPRPLVRDYLNILFEKVLLDDHPSIPMLLRIRRVVDAY
jgi:hypothetical protein